MPGRLSSAQWPPAVVCSAELLPEDWSPRPCEIINDTSQRSKDKGSTYQTTPCSGQSPGNGPAAIQARAGPWNECWSQGHVAFEGHPLDKCLWTMGQITDGLMGTRGMASRFQVPVLLDLQDLWTLVCKRQLQRGMETNRGVSSGLVGVQGRDQASQSLLRLPPGLILLTGRNKHYKFQQCFKGYISWLLGPSKKAIPVLNRKG